MFDLLLHQMNDKTRSVRFSFICYMCLFHFSGPSFFDQQWRSRIKDDCGDNWRLKVSNLKKVHKGIMNYYNDVSHFILFIASPGIL